MTTKRMFQMGEQIRDFIATMLVRGEIRDPRIKNVTIHSVKMTSDLQIAKVYFVCSSTSASTSTDKNFVKEIEAGLKAAASFIRQKLGKELQIRYIPQILFYYDDSLEYSIKMGAILNEVGAELRRNEEKSSSSSSSSDENNEDEK
jgi:ribosome-binding factor A